MVVRRGGLAKGRLDGAHQGRPRLVFAEVGVAKQGRAEIERMRLACGTGGRECTGRVRWKGSRQRKAEEVGWMEGVVERKGVAEG